MKSPLIAIVLLTIAAVPTALTRAANIKAEQRQAVHPVLIRNDANALLQLRIDSPENGTAVTQLMFDLSGTDDLGDIESVQVFATGQRERSSTDTPFANAKPAAKRVDFRGDVRLAKGLNVFWLSCKLRPTASLSHRVGAVCTQVVTSAGTVKPDAPSPKIRKRIGVALRKHNDNGVHTHRIPALTTTNDGTLLAVYDLRRRKSRDLQEDIDIGLSRSTDGGQTWESPRVIMDMGEYNGLPQEQNGVSDPGILVDPATGEIFCAAVWMWGRPGTHQWNKGGSDPGFEIGTTAQFLMVRSEDDGLTWSKPENLTRKLKKEEWILFAPSPQQGISLRDGTLVLPSQGRDEQDRMFSNLMISRDHGETWTLSSPASLGNTECQAVELSDGSIMLNARTERPTNFRTVAVTRDLGQTWKPHATNRKDLIEPNCNGSLYRFDYKRDGKQQSVLLFANPQSQQARTHHSIQVSFDEGRTWPKEHRILLDEGLGRGYPSLSRVDNEHVGIVYEGSQADLVFERLSLDELLKNRK